MKTINIATVDNDEIFLFIMERYFELFDKMEVQLFPLLINDPQVLLNQMHLGYSPELILLDLNMPIMNGFDFLDEYHKRSYPTRYPDTRVFILTSSISKFDKLRASKYEIVKAFIEKDCNDKELLDEIVETYMDPRIERYEYNVYA